MRVAERAKMFRMRSFALFAALLVFLPRAAQGQEVCRQVAAAINAVRSSHGLVELALDDRLRGAAESQSVWMAEVGRMDHLREPPRSFEEFVSCEYHPSNRAVRSGYFRFEELFGVDRSPTGAAVHPLPAANENLGEIIARGKGGRGAYDHRAVVEGWMNSPGHRREILKPSYREMGVFMRSPRFGETYWCVVFAHR